MRFIDLLKWVTVILFACRRDETVACLPGSLETVVRRSVSHVNEYTEMHLSGISPTT